MTGKKAENVAAESASSKLLPARKVRKLWETHGLADKHGYVDVMHETGFENAVRALYAEAYAKGLARS